MLVDVEGKKPRHCDESWHFYHQMQNWQQNEQDNPTVLVEFLVFLLSAGGACAHQDGEPQRIDWGVVSCGAFWRNE